MFHGKALAFPGREPDAPRAFLQGEESFPFEGCLFFQLLAAVIGGLVGQGILHLRLQIDGLIRGLRPALIRPFEQ